MTQPVVQFLKTDPAVICAETTLNADIHKLYAFIANPAKHCELDGGGSVQKLLSQQTPELKTGDRFTEKMFLLLPYRMTLTVTRAQKNQFMTWRHPAGHEWGWELIDHHNGSVTVRETFDAREARWGRYSLHPIYKVLGMYSRNRKNIALSLAKLHRTFK
ncbi:polyketide cyclase [Rothia sp. P13129]|uniref:polyketide cyclase n=1 Tax=unclassified Rothia (in: high G+C Gram-positive bacteria) TaxID=2689056 RepID=UPI003AD44BC3